LQSFPYHESQLFVHGKLVSTEKCTIASSYTIVKCRIVSSDFTLGTHNKAKVGNHRIIPFCKSLPYCKSWLFAHGKLVSTETCSTVVSFMLLRSLSLRVLTLVFFLSALTTMRNVRITTQPSLCRSCRNRENFLSLLTIPRITNVLYVKRQVIFNLLKNNNNNFFKKNRHLR